VDSSDAFGGALNGLVIARCDGGSGGTELFGIVATGSCDSPFKLATTTTIPDPTTNSPSTIHVISTTGLGVSSRRFGGGGAEVTGCSASCETSAENFGAAGAGSSEKDGARGAACGNRLCPAEPAGGGDDGGAPACGCATN
jgi:hypothetical protein